MFTREALEACGFAGFTRLSSSKTAGVPAVAGVYIVYRPGTDHPVFLPKSKAGRHEDPSKPADVVAQKWVDGAQVVYIGMATVLRKRIAQYRRFGAGTSDAHRGGCYIWQLEDQANLQVAWRVTAAGEDPRTAEAALIERFTADHGGRMPFANLRR